MTEAALAFDLGGTDLRGALVTREGKVHRLITVATQAQDGVQAILDQMIKLATELRNTANGFEIVGAGVGAPGPLDPNAGLMLSPPTLNGWDNVPLARLLSDELGLPVKLENDANAAALGEWQFGAGRGYGTVLFVTISTGIGGGVISEGKVFHGSQGLAVEIGHMTISESGPRCLCGSIGCFEALASGTALGQRGAKIASTPEGREILSSTTENGHIGARAVVEAARNGDKIAISLLADEARWLGIGLTNLLHLFSPDVVIIGGGVSNAFDLLIDDIKSEIRERAMPAFSDVEIVRAELGSKAGIVGAASLVFT